GSAATGAGCGAPPATSGPPQEAAEPRERAGFSGLGAQVGCPEISYFCSDCAQPVPAGPPTAGPRYRCQLPRGVFLDPPRPRGRREAGSRPLASPGGARAAEGALRQGGSRPPSRPLEGTPV